MRGGQYSKVYGMADSAGTSSTGALRLKQPIQPPLQKNQTQTGPQSLKKQPTGVEYPNLRDSEFAYHKSDHFTVVHHPIPLLRHHSLVIPHRSIQSITELNGAERADLKDLYGRIVPLLIRSAGHHRQNPNTSYITALQTGEYEGRQVEGLHLHILPRVKEDPYSANHDGIYVDLYERSRPSTVKAETLLQDVQRLRRAATLYYLNADCIPKDSSNTHIAGDDTFCKIEEFRHVVLFETDAFRVLYNPKPIVRGHILITTKNHVKGLLELNTPEVMKLYDILDHTIPRLLEFLGTDQYDLKIRSGIYSGRTIDHFHIHLIPRPLLEDGTYERFYADQEVRRESNVPSEVMKDKQRLQEVLRTV